MRRWFLSYNSQDSRLMQRLEEAAELGPPFPPARHRLAGRSTPASANSSCCDDCSRSRVKRYPGAAECGAFAAVEDPQSGHPEEIYPNGFLLSARVNPVF